jgi:hypothetical protein
VDNFKGIPENRGKNGVNFRRFQVRPIRRISPHSFFRVALRTR